MSMRASFHYQLKNLRWSIVIYYIVVVCLWLLIGASIVGFTRDAGAGTLDGIAFRGHTYINFFGASTPIFLFVLGLNTFKENFGMLCQNGLSRKSVFWGRNATAAAVALGMAVVDSVFSLVMRLSLAAAAPRLTVITSSIASDFFKTLPGPLAVLAEFIYSFAGYYLMMTIGYCITILFFRLNKAGKVIVGAGVPALFMIVLPLVDQLLLGSRLTLWMDRVSGAYAAFMAANPFMHILAQLAAGALFTAIAWLMMRKAVVRK